MSTKRKNAFNELLDSIFTKTKRYKHQRDKAKETRELKLRKML